MPFLAPNFRRFNPFLAPNFRKTSIFAPDYQCITNYEEISKKTYTKNLRFGQNLKRENHCFYVEQDK